MPDIWLRRQSALVTDIKDVAIRNGPNSSRLHAVHANGNIYINNISDVFSVVKSMEGKKGGLLVLPRYHLDFIDRCHSLSSLHLPLAALASLPTGMFLNGKGDSCPNCESR